MDKNKIYQFIAETLHINIDIVNEDLGIGDIPEWDSLAHVMLLSRIEEKFGVSLDADQALDIETVGDLMDILKELTGYAHSSNN